MYACMHVCTKCLYLKMSMYTETVMYRYLYMYAFMHTSMKYMCMHVYLHMYMYMQIYTYIYIYIHMFLPRVLHAFFAAVCCWPEAACDTSCPAGRACRVRACGYSTSSGLLFVFRVAGGLGGRGGGIALGDWGGGGCRAPGGTIYVYHKIQECGIR